MSFTITSRKTKRTARHARIRGRVIGTRDTPRLAVFRSNQHMYAQLIDDEGRATLGAANDLKLKEKEKIERAVKVGALIAAIAQKKGIKRVVFDRGGFKYHGIVKALAQGARDAGLQF